MRSHIDLSDVVASLEKEKEHLHLRLAEKPGPNNAEVIRDLAVELTNLKHEKNDLLETITYLQAELENKDQNHKKQLFENKALISRQAERGYMRDLALVEIAANRKWFFFKKDKHPATIADKALKELSVLRNKKPIPAL